MTIQVPGQRSKYELKSTRPFRSGRLTDLYLANDLQSDQEVVLKVFRFSVGSPEIIDGFDREIDALHRLKHPNILELMDHGSGEPIDESYFLVLPYMRGGNLRGLLQGKQFCPSTLALPLLRQVANALDYAHENGIVHGDIKPENILLSVDHQTALLADFGVARHFDVHDRVQISVAFGQRGVAGTSAYLSPEQLSENQQTAKSDIYSLGLVAYELLTGKLPYDVQAPLYQQMKARVSGDLIHPHELNPALSDGMVNALRKVLDPKHENRPKTATSFASLLELQKAWDVFIAHSGHDKDIAEIIYGQLSPKMRVFLDTKCLNLGVDWDLELSRAQRDALITLVLVSERVERSFYQREEIASAIRMSREAPNQHRVVPVFLDDASSKNPPYGLQLKHGIKFNRNQGELQISEPLFDVLSEMTMVL